MSDAHANHLNSDRFLQGTPTHVRYPIGSIEFDALHLKADHAYIEFDANGIVSKVATSS